MDDLLHLHQTTDCAVWEEAFMKTFPNCGIPEGTMVGWFANAMMAKADEVVALAPSPSAHVAGLREAAGILQNMAPSYKSYDSGRDAIDDSMKAILARADELEAKP